MFVVSKKTEYALKAVLDLSRHFAEEAVPLTDIATRQDIPLKYLEQIMLLIKKAGLVESRRGIGGGFRLIKSPQEITLGRLMRVVEGDAQWLNGRRGRNELQTDAQAFEEVWVNVTQAVSDIVDRVTFADIMRRADELWSENSDFNFII